MAPCLSQRQFRTLATSSGIDCASNGDDMEDKIAATSSDSDLHSCDSSDFSYKKDSTNKAFMEFIQQEKTFLHKLISGNMNDCHSERLLALKRSQSLRSYRYNALEEEKLIMETHKIMFGDYVDPYVLAIQKLLTYSRKRNEDDITDFGGTFFVDLKIRNISTYYETVRYVAFPELLTLYLSRSENITYKDASRRLYGEQHLPTMHHTQFLLDDIGIESMSQLQPSKTSTIIVQVVKKDITEERTHAIVNAANSQLEHGGGVAAAISNRGGFSIQRDSREYVLKCGTVPVGSVVAAMPGELYCYHLLHAVGPRWGKDKPEVSLLSKVIKKSLELADSLKCRSISIPAVSCGIFSNAKSLNHSVATIKDAIFDQIMGGSIRNIDVVRIVINDDDLIKRFYSIDAYFKNKRKR